MKQRCMPTRTTCASKPASPPKETVAAQARHERADWPARLPAEARGWVDGLGHLDPRHTEARAELD